MMVEEALLQCLGQTGVVLLVEVGGHIYICAWGTLVVRCPGAFGCLSGDLGSRGREVDDVGCR